MTNSWGSKLIDRWIAFRWGAVDLTASLVARGEQAAAIYLRRKGYRIVRQNERGGIGEIDLVAVHKRRVIFVEVKTRSSDRFGHPGDHVDDHKAQQLTRAALAFLKRHRLLEHPSRIDVVAVWWPDGKEKPDRIEHYENAVSPTGQYQWFS